MSEDFKEYEDVRVRKSPSLDRLWFGRLPQIGDEGIIIDINDFITASTITYIVEAVAADGYTIWLADFTADEIERLEK